MKKILKSLYSVLYNKFRNRFIKVKYNKVTKNFKIIIPSSFEDRAIKTAEMITTAFEYARPNIKNSFSMKVSIEDFENQDKTYSYSLNSFSKLNYLIPDFCFMNWKESGMKDYDECWKEIVEESKKPIQYNTLFWIGNTKTHPSRCTLCQLSEKDSRIEAYGMDWKYKDGKTIPSKFISLVDHTKYKYLIDVQGRGYSGRVKMLLFTGRPLFLVERKWIEYFYEDLKPYIHYIPVKEDLSDLIEKLDWAENHYKEAKQIGQNAQYYAINNLKRIDAIMYLSKKLEMLSNKK